MRIRVSGTAEQQLQTGFWFYERQSEGLGDYFLDSLTADIESLHVHAGVHVMFFGTYYRLLAKRFPYAVYYGIDNEEILIHAVLDNRRSPGWIKTQITPRSDSTDE